VRILDHDDAAGALLLERVVPGRPVHEIEEESESTLTAARLMKRLWREPPSEHSFPSLSTWFRAFPRLRASFNGGTGPFAEELIAKAESTFVELNADSHQFLLHGDLHHTNILSSERGGWVAIDPKGVIGDPGYEVGAFVRNQLPATESKIMEALDRRLSIFSDELQISYERLAQWSFFHAVLSAIWSFEESEDVEKTIGIAQLLSDLS
jgi:streptomycin 6-kinase